MSLTCGPWVLTLEPEVWASPYHVSGRYRAEEKVFIKNLAGETFPALVPSRITLASLIK